MNNITAFLQKLKYYFIKIILEVKNRTYDINNHEQNMYLAIILIITGICGLIILDD